MGLHVENKKRRALPFCKRGGLYKLDVQDIEECSEHRIHRHEGRRHASRGSEKVTPTHSRARRAFRGKCSGQHLHAGLSRRLWGRINSSFDTMRVGKGVEYSPPRWNASER